MVEIEVSLVTAVHKANKHYMQDDIKFSKLPVSFRNGYKTPIWVSILKHTGLVFILQNQCLLENPWRAPQINQCMGNDSLNGSVNSADFIVVQQFIKTSTYFINVQV